MGSLVMNGAVIGRGALIGAGSLIPEGAKIKPESLYFGRPTKFVRKLTKREVKQQMKWAEKYVRLAEAHAKGIFRNL